MADSEEFVDGFPTEPIGGGNPYHRCADCKKSVPAINYRLDGHRSDCGWAALERARRMIPKVELRVTQAKDADGVYCWEFRVDGEVVAEGQEGYADDAYLKARLSYVEWREKNR